MVLSMPHLSLSCLSAVRESLQTHFQNLLGEVRLCRSAVSEAADRVRALEEQLTDARHQHTVRVARLSAAEEEANRIYNQFAEVDAVVQIYRDLEAQEAESDSAEPSD